ncbi:MAG: hypothetical protein ACLVK8_00935 [Ruminococcus sp.]
MKKGTLFVDVVKSLRQGNDSGGGVKDPNLYYSVSATTHAPVPAKWTA